MKKTSLYFGAVAIAGALAIAMPAITNAEERGPGPREGGKPTRLENIQNNRDLRNTKLDEMRRASTSTAGMRKLADTRPSGPMMTPGWIRSEKGPFKRASSTDDRPDFLDRIASSTLVNHEKMKEIRLDRFALLHTNLLRQANNSLSKLQELRARIALRIQTAEGTGRDMTSAKEALKEADEKIAAAAAAVKSLEGYVPPVVASTTNATSSSIVKLDKPREIGKDALSALKEAKKALQEVIVAIAHAMGLKKGQDGSFEGSPTPTPAATSTPTATPAPTATSTPTSTPTPTPTATSTATTTNQ